MPVIARSHDHQDNLIQSVVGITVIAEEDTALVQPLVHPSFELGVRIEHSQEWAILSGNSGRTNEALLTYITSDFSPKQAIFTQPAVPLIKNALVYTSGAGGIFPAGIPVGIVSGTGRRKYDFKTAYVQPFVKISELSYVSVIIKDVEKWAQTWKEELHWQDHLKTEFGEPVYPKLSKSERKAQARAQKKEGPQTPSAQDTAPRESQTPDVKPKQVREAPRRLQNVDPFDPKKR